MPILLRIDCSPRGPDAHCWRMADELVEHLCTARADLVVARRVLSETQPPFVDHDFARGMGTHTTAETARGVAALATSEHLIGELEAAAIVVLATPMHNYTVPACLKAWIDQVVRVGRTFKITPEGKVGSLADRPTYVVVSSGGYYTGEKARQPDFLSPYLTAILATIGIRDVGWIRMEGLTRGELPLAEAYAGARATIAGLTAAQASKNA